MVQNNIISSIAQGNFDIGMIYNVPLMTQSFYEIIDTLFIKMDLLNFQAWTAFISLYVAPSLLIYFLIKGLLEDINLFPQNASKIAAVMTIIALPPGVYIVAWTIANLAVLGILGLFGTLILLGISAYYRRKLKEFKFILGSKELTQILIHLPLLFVFTLIGHIAGNIYGNVSFMMYAGITFGVFFIVKAVWDYQQTKSKSLGNDVFLPIRDNPSILIYFAIGLLIVLMSVFGVGSGAVVGFAVGYFLMKISSRDKGTYEVMKTASNILKTTEQTLKDIELALEGIDALLSSPKEERVNTYNSLSNDVKRALGLFGILSGKITDAQLTNQKQNLIILKERLTAKERVVLSREAEEILRKTEDI